MEGKKKYSKRKCLTCSEVMDIIKTDTQRYHYCEPCDKKDFFIKVCCNNDCRVCMGTVEL